MGTGAEGGTSMTSEPTDRASTTAAPSRGNADATADNVAATENEPRVMLGSGVFVQGAGGRAANMYADDEGVTMNFERASLPEFLQVVFEIILNENYLIDPQVSGTVTLNTTRPVTQAAVLPIVESVLEQNGAALIQDEGVYKIVPLADAAGASNAPGVGRFPSSRTEGFGIQVVPLQHVSAAEIQGIVGPFVPRGSSLTVDEARNVLILSGPKYRLDDLLATIRTFDVDWLKGMSFAMIRLEYADAASVVEELEAVINLGGESPLAGIVRLMPVERLNAVLVITHSPEHVAEVQKIIDQFDWGLEGAAGRRLFVYELENGDAQNVARVLQQVFGVGARAFQDDDSGFGAGSQGVFRSAESVSRPPPAPGQIGVSPSAAARTPGTGIAADSEGEITIIADPDNNAILVMASPQDYNAVEATIRRLDVPPRQVLIEANVAEVTLSDTLSHGVRWFIENTNNNFGFNAPVPSQAAGDGFAFAFLEDSGDVRAFFDILATESSVKFLSTPQVMVLDNQTANIRVGDQIPVTTRSSQSTVDPNAPIVTEVQFRDTGTLLSVTPRINSGGQITLDVSQEVSLPGTEPAVGGGGNVSIAQRTINSSVIVQDGQTVVLGGLILETENEGQSGIPGLMSIPVVGGLFKTKSIDKFRTELIVTVRPRIIEDPVEMQRVTDELRLRMGKVTEYRESVSE
jgi:general secretion pathway protein D